MINKQKLWFLTLFSLILVLTVYYIAVPEYSLSNLIEEESIKSNDVTVSLEEEDTLATLRIADDEEMLSEMENLQSVLTDAKTGVDEKNLAFEKLKNLNLTKGKEDALENKIYKKFNLKSFIKIKDDQINVTISSKQNSYKDANDIIRCIQEEYAEKKYITVKYQ